MNQKFQTSLFLFRRDLRLEDNTGLIFALKNSEKVIPAFIFTPEQIDSNPYRSDHCLKFMIESLEDLIEQLKEKGANLYIFQGKSEEIVTQCIRELSVDALIVNRDYTPYSRKRDKMLEDTCKKEHIPFFSFDDALLHPPEETLKKDGKPYTIFTPYFHNASKNTVPSPVRNTRTNYFHGPIPFAEKTTLLAKICPQKTHNTLMGGRRQALKVLKQLRALGQYEHLRNFPAEDYSTHLSPYLKFTVCSPREIYAAISHDLNPQHELIRALYWRDFFTGIAFFFPHVFKKNFNAKFDDLRWTHNQNTFQKWCEGSTGFPIVDAGMREMNETGFMHNRVRMITASFLVKDLHIDWKWGEKYFAQTLIDYDPAVNNGNWQWVASVGCDAQPYFRIFNPWTQQKKFDPDCIYIKKWIPELKDLSPTKIHGWMKKELHEEYPHYPPPMTDHESAAKEALLTYKKNHSSYG